MGVAPGSESRVLRLLSLGLEPARVDCYARAAGGDRMRIVLRLLGLLLLVVVVFVAMLALGIRGNHLPIADPPFAKVKEAIARLPRWEIVESKDDTRQLHAVVTSGLFRFKDDVTVSVVPQPGGKPQVTMRAVSRVGKGDLGTNTRHVMDLYDALEQVGAHGEVERMTSR